jgi:hypothetical protein
LTAVAPVIKDAIGASNANQSAEMLKQYRNNIRDKMGTKYMSIQESLKAGKDASDVLNPLMESLTQALETKIGITDPLMIKLAIMTADYDSLLNSEFVDILKAVTINSENVKKRALNTGVINRIPKKNKKEKSTSNSHNLGHNQRGLKKIKVMHASHRSTWTIVFQI